ncbi:hypothetical protein K439DRAFT_1345601 [Ramaria rubella]|nr:hypothetical protein K439DRAFT_1345601 [Ramaria rubella]
MPVHWNTWYAEIERAIKLKLAINQCIDQLDQGLTGQKKCTAACKKRTWFLSPGDWDMLTRLCKILEIFHQATLELSKAGVPTICKVLPIYKLVEGHLQHTLRDCKLEYDPRGLEKLINAGLTKLNKYLKQAIESDYVLLGAVLHPSIWIAYFEDRTCWDPEVAKRARTLVDHLHDLYTEETQESETQKPDVPGSSTNGSSIFMQAICGMQNKLQAHSTNEVESYFSGAYPCVDEDVLGWYRVSVIPS